MNGGNLLYRKLKQFIALFSVTQLGILLSSGLAQAAQPTFSAPAVTGCAATPASIGDVVCKTAESLIGGGGSFGAVSIFPAICYLFGLFIGVFAIAKMYEHVQNPNQVSVWEPLKRTLCAGCLFSLPMVVEAVYNTLAAGSGTYTVTNFKGNAATGGLDTMMVNLLNDTYSPTYILLFGFCFIAGTALVIIGIMRLLKSAQDGPRGPGGFGTIMTFIVAGALFSFDEMIAAFTQSQFGDTQVEVGANIQFQTQGAQIQHIEAVISAALAFVMILGWISFIRGWFIIRDVAEGNQQASLMAGMTHLFGGALAINLGPVLNAVQTTLGLTPFGIVFS